MDKLIRKMLGSHATDAVQAIRELHTKESRADHLRLLEDDLIEAKASFTMLARLYLHLGIAREEIKVSVDKVVEAYRIDSMYRDYSNRRTDTQKITLFARMMVTEAVKHEQVRELLRKETLLSNFKQLDDKQILWYRAFRLLIPNGMRNVIEKYGTGIEVYGFLRNELED